MESKLIFEEESYKILGVCIAVHKKMGSGFEQEVYEEVLQKEFVKHGIPFEKKKKLSFYYEGDPLQKYFIADIEIVIINTQYNCFDTCTFAGSR